MTTNPKYQKYDSHYYSNTYRVHSTLPILFVAIILVFNYPVTAHAQQNIEFLYSLMESKKSTAQKRQEIRHEFAEQPGRLINVIEELDYQDVLAHDIALLCQESLSELLERKDSELLLSRIETASSPRIQGILAGVLPKNRRLIQAVKYDPDPVLQLLVEETNSLQVVKALAEVLSRAQVYIAAPTIRSKMKLEHINFNTTISLEASLIRLGDELIINKYAEFTKSQDFKDLNLAVNIFARSESPGVMKYLIPWLDIKDYPKIKVNVDPPYRYCDVAVRFANFFRYSESSPLLLSYIPQYSDAEIEEVRDWWQTVRDTDKYR